MNEVRRWTLDMAGVLLDVCYSTRTAPALRGVKDEYNPWIHA